MIGEPFNDVDCLGPITDFLRTLIEEDDEAVIALAERFSDEAALVEYIRSRPQRDDLGNPADGPRVHACTPSQRLRLDPQDPNCLERAALHVLVAERIDPSKYRQLVTLPTPIGMHTFPAANDRPVVLDPRVTYDCLECGMALSRPGPIAVDPRKALAWTIDMASQQAGAMRNGPSAYPVGRRAILRLVDRGGIPTPGEVDSMGILFALAEYASKRYGTRALEIVRVAARAVSSVLDTVLARRNAHLDIGGLRFDTPRWLDEVGTAVGNTGLDIGGAVARQKLDALDLAGMLGLPGGTAGLVGLLEAELGKQGRTLGTLAHPPSLATFAQHAAPKSG